MTFEEVVKHYEKYINYLTHKYYINNYTTDDIRQLVLMAFYKAYQTYDGRSKFTTYATMRLLGLLAVPIDKSIKERKALHNENDLERLDTFMGETNIERDSKKQALHEALWGYVNKHRYGLIVRYMYIGKMTPDRIAEVLNITVTKVYSRYSVFLKEIRYDFGQELKGYDL